LPPHKDDLNKSITHLAEAVLLPCQGVVYMFYQLATVLLSRFSVYNQPDDLKSSVEYLRFLNFRTLEAFDISDGRLASLLALALAVNLRLGSGDMVQDMEEMAASDVSTDEPRRAIAAFIDAVTETEIFRRKHTQQVAERVIRILREAAVLKPDSHDVSCALAGCLAARFKMTHVMNDYEEAMTLVDKIIAALTPGDTLTLTQDHTIRL
jgi:hypothetical protein